MFWGCDINPVATMIARVKTRHYQDLRLVRYFNAIKDEFARSRPVPVDYKHIGERIRYWFDERNINNLIRLDQAIRRQIPSNSPYRRFFQCGFSNILKPTSRWLTKSIKAQFDPHKSPRAVMEAFEDQFSLMRKANETNLFPSTSPRACIQTRKFSGTGQIGFPSRPDSHQPTLRNVIRLCRHPSVVGPVVALWSR